MFGIISIDKLFPDSLAEEHIKLMNAPQHRLSRKQATIEKGNNFLFSTDDYLITDDYLVLFKGKLNNLESTYNSEHILAGYKKSANKFISNLKGAFVILIYNRTKQEVEIYRDVLGLEPIYYVVTKVLIYFSSEIKRLAAISTLTSINWAYIKLELYSNAYPSSHEATWFSKIKRIPPGNYLRSGEDFNSIEQYINLTQLENKENSSSVNLIQKTEALLIMAIKKAIEGVDNIATHLSGGLDSTLITTITKYLTEETGSALRTYVCGLTEEQAKNPYKVIDATSFVKRICSEKNLPIPEVVSDNDNLSIADLRCSLQLPRNINLNNYLRQVCERMYEQKSNVLLSGFGGDEGLSFHYSPLVVQRAFRTLQWSSLWTDRAGFKWRYLLYHGSLALLDLFRKNKTIKKEQLLKLSPDKQRRSKRTTRVKQAMQDYLGAYHIAYRVEREKEYCSYYDIEIKYPLLDQELIEQVLSLPAKVIFNGKQSRGLMRTLCKKWLGISDFDQQNKSKIPTVPIEQLRLVKAIDQNLFDFEKIMVGLHPKLKTEINTQFSAPKDYSNKLDQRRMRIYIILAEMDLFVKMYSSSKNDNG